MFRLTNTLTGALESFAPLDGETVRMYACGPTVYNYVHIGNLRTYVFEDVLRRHLLSKWKLKHVMNITDIDDKIIKGSIASRTDLKTLTAPFTQAFFEDCQTIRIQRPDVITPATDYIPEMIEMVSALLAGGYAYEEGGSVYFRISKFPAYGRLARLDKRELKIGARIDVDEYEKENPTDFVLWKAPKEEFEPRWEAPFGVGRPGWHIECSAMAMKNLGASIDIHCGGVDNIFPHHDNEIAQSEAATGKQFVRFWVHGEHLLVEGEKMAKSKNNFYTLRDLLDRGHDALAIRYLLVSVPYRKQLNFTFDGLQQAERTLDRIKEFVFHLQTGKFEAGADPGISALLSASRGQFEAGLDDDLNTAQALAAVFELVRQSNIALSKGTLKEENRDDILKWFEIVDERLAIFPPLDQLVESDVEIEALIAVRTEARRNRDFALSDEVRQKLLGLGVLIEDTREGTKWRRK